MFEILVEQSITLNPDLNANKRYAKNMGIISIDKFIQGISPHVIKTNLNSKGVSIDRYVLQWGWKYEDLWDKNGIENFYMKRTEAITVISDPEKICCITICLPEPKKIVEDGVKIKKEEEFDLIKKPSHYVQDRIYEPRKVIHDWGLNFNLGNAVKYIARAGKKGNIVEDLQKAIHYIKFEIEEINASKEQLNKKYGINGNTTSMSEETRSELEDAIVWIIEDYSISREIADKLDELFDIVLKEETK